MEICRSLVAEHDVILRVLDALEREAEQVEAGAPIRTDFFTSAIDFVRQFADGIHHRKEEGILFPALAGAGIPNEGGPIGVMLYEHDEGRAHIRGMDSALGNAAKGDAQSRHTLIRETRGYVSLLRAHIMKENQILFPMADRVFDENTRARVLTAFAEAEEKDVDVTDERRRWAEGLK
jgi:hemerythrin-like domain-containing protein